MATVSAKVATRIRDALKRFQPILANAKSRDLNESDTSMIVTDLLDELLGYDKYGEVTREHAIRGTFCDLAIKLDNALALLIEVKAVGTELKDAHIKQAVDYAANQGCEWVILTNGLVWRAYRVTFAKPIDHELVVEFNLCELNPRSDDHIELVALLAKEGWQKAHIGDYHSQKQALSRFSIAALALSEPVLDIFRRELRRLSPGIRVENDQVEKVLREEVLKRDVLEGEKAEAARRLVSRAASKALRAKAEKSTDAEEGEPTGVTPPTAPEPAKA